MTNKALEQLAQLDTNTLESLLKLLAQQNEIESNPKEEPQLPIPKITKATLYRDRLREVTVRSCVSGKIIYKSKRTGMTYRWLEKDSYEILTIEELLNMDSQSRAFLHNPWLVVEDEDVIEAFGLGAVYESIATVEDMDSFINLPLAEQQKIYNNLSKSYQNYVFTSIWNKVENQEVESIKKIRELEELLQEELEY